MSKRHIFLTGERQVGKTTIIRNYLSQAGLSADGLITFWETGDDFGGRLYISPFSSDLRHEEKYLIVDRDKRNRGLPEEVARVFDVHGCEILADSGKCDVIVLDELGFFESNAADFHKSVMRLLSGDVPVLGVVKPMQTEFLDSIRAHPDVEVWEVTAENRNAVLERLLKHDR